MSGLGNKEIMARNIKRFMELKRKDRNEICKDLDIKYTTFTDWINGNTYPRIDKIEMMANYFGISKADLVEERTDQQQYYFSPEVESLAQEMMDKPNLHMLCDASRNLSEEDMRFVIDMVNRMNQ